MAASLGLASAAQAQVINVNPDGTSGSNNLAAAINTANTDYADFGLVNGAFVLDLAPGRYAPTGPLPAIAAPITITGSHSAAMSGTTPATYVDGSLQATGSPGGGLFTVNSGASLTLEALQVENGSGPAVTDNGALTTWGVTFANEAGAAVVVSGTGSTAALNESTIDGSTGAYGLVASSAGVATLKNTDVVGNPGGGISVAAGTVTPTNSLIADNATGTTGNCSGALSGASNDESDTSSCGGSPQVTVSSALATLVSGGFTPLANNGGPTETVAVPTADLIGGSSCPTTDERFYANASSIVGTTCSVGSYAPAGVLQTGGPVCHTPVITTNGSGVGTSETVQVTDTANALHIAAGFGPQSAWFSDPVNPAEAIANVGVPSNNGTVVATINSAPSPTAVTVTATKSAPAVSAGQLTHWFFSATDWSGNSTFCS